MSTWRMASRRCEMSLCLLLIFAYGFMSTGCQSFPKKPDITGQENLQTQSESWEWVEGKKIHDAVVASQYIYAQEELKNYVSGIGIRLAQYAMRTNLPYTFTILVDERIYSTSAPGGYVYITTGLINFIECEAELAAVLAHEIGEVQLMRPHFTAYKRSTQDLATLSAMVGPFFGPVGALSAAGFILLSSLPVEASQEENLFSADRTAMNLMVQAGYDPQGLIDMLQKTQNEQSNSSVLVSDWQNRRPVNSARLAKSKESFAQLSLDGLELAAEYEKYQMMTRGVRDMYGRV